MDDLVARFRRYVSGLSDEQTLVLHRIVCKRAAYIYGERYRQIQERNFRTAMGIRDTRFQPGLAPLENAERCARPLSGRTP